MNPLLFLFGNLGCGITAVVIAVMMVALFVLLLLGVANIAVIVALVTGHWQVALWIIAFFVFLRILRWGLSAHTPHRTENSADGENAAPRQPTGTIDRGSVIDAEFKEIP